MTRCGNCDYPLLCQHCGRKFSLADHERYDTFNDRTQAVLCPYCEETLACQNCGYTYDGAEDLEDLEDRPR